MCKVTISAFQMIQGFPNEDAARLHIENNRCGGQPIANISLLHESANVE
jgi:hypothetical protein